MIEQWSVLIVTVEIRIINNTKVVSRPLSDKVVQHEYKSH